QPRAGIGGWLRWRVEQGQKACVLVVIEEECTLVQDRFLSLTTRAVQHEFRQLLAAQGRGSIEECFRLRRSADLDDVILASKRCGHDRSQQSGTTTQYRCCTDIVNTYPRRSMPTA